MKKDKFYLYTGNHSKTVGIEDFISILKDIFYNNGTSLIVTDKLKDEGVYLIIDEFINYSINKKIRKFKKNTNSKFIFVLTEFVEKKTLFETFNYYSGIDRYFYTPFIDIYLRLMRDDFGKVGARSIFSASISIVPAVIILIGKYIFYSIKQRRLNGFISEERGYMQYFIYLHMRYLGLSEMIDVASSVICPHQGIVSKMKSSRAFKQQSNYFVFYPVFPKVDFSHFFIGSKILGIKVTGSITKYRKKCVRKVNTLLLKYGLLNMEITKTVSFDDNEHYNSYFSYHPVQIKGWPYSSPTRIYRAITIDNTIPLIDTVHNDHIIEKLCFLLDKESINDLLEIVDSPKTVENYWKVRIDCYLDEAHKSNKKMLQWINNYE